MKKIKGFSIAVLLGFLNIGFTQESEQLRKELQRISEAYKKQIQRLEKRISELENKAAKKNQGKNSGADKRTEEIAVKTNNKQVMNQGKKGFNPNVSLIFNGSYNHFKRDPDNYRMPGFVLAEETGPGERGFSLNESELVISANIDHMFFGRMTLAMTAENEVEVEEAFIQTLALPGGLSFQAGRFFSEIGYLNSIHAHAWDFADTPLVYRAMLGNKFLDDGVQIRWLAPIGHFLEFGVEAFKGGRFPSAGSSNEGIGAYTLNLSTGGDLANKHSWQAGIWFLRAEAKDRTTDDLVFNGDSDLYGIDLIMKFNFGQSSHEGKLTWLSEYIQRSEKGVYTDLGAYDAKQTGWYTQLIYQFNKNWRTGVRYDALEADDPGTTFSATALNPEDHQANRVSFMLDYSTSEFSRWRLQYNRDESSAQTDHQWYIQYIMSMGTHQAHRF